MYFKFSCISAKERLFIGNASDIMTYCNWLTISSKINLSSVKAYTLTLSRQVYDYLNRIYSKLRHIHDIKSSPWHCLNYHNDYQTTMQECIVSRYLHHEISCRKWLKDTTKEYHNDVTSCEPYFQFMWCFQGHHKRTTPWCSWWCHFLSTSTQAHKHTNTRHGGQISRFAC